MNSWYSMMEHIKRSAPLQREKPIESTSLDIMRYKKKLKQKLHPKRENLYNCNKLRAFFFFFINIENN